MRACGTCTLCCKIPRIPVLNKPQNEWCRFCEIDVGCGAYQDRPQVCRDFTCLWLQCEDMPERFSPDRTHLYVSVSDREKLTKVFVDADYPLAWKEGPGQELVESLIDGGNHVLIVMGMQVTFVPGKGRPVPDKIQLDWLL